MIINTPFSGKLNLDDADYRVSNNDYIDALNVTKDAQGAGQDKVVSNILGNTIISYNTPSGTNKVIGFYPDKVRNRAYYFIWNSNGYNTILYYDLNTEQITTILQSKTDSDNIDILNFNPSYKVLSVNIYYRDLEGDILFFNDGFNPPRNINIDADYGTSWKAEYLLVIKAPPIMPPKVVYINDKNVTINNLRNKLFQFSYRFIYDNNEKSVWSSKSIVPLPQQPTLQLTEQDFYNNSGISISVSTGGVNVKKIELSFRETTSGITSDWYLIKQIDKLILNILDNDIFTFNFYNDSIYTQIDINETIQLQDWVPQKANAAELANGNVLLYAGIVEGYDKTDVNLEVETAIEKTNFFIDNSGLLFFAESNGIDSGSIGTEMKVYVFGTLSDIPLPTTTTTTSVPGPSTTTTTVSPSINFYLATSRRRCDTGVESIVRVYINFTDNSYVPTVGKWYKEDTCPIYTYQINSTTVYHSVISSGTLLITEYSSGALACICPTTTTTTILGTTTSTTTTTTTTIAPNLGLNNPAGTYVINVKSSTGTDIGISYTYNNSAFLPVLSLLTSVGNLLIAKGWTVSISNNVLTATYSDRFILYSSGVKYLAPTGVPDNTSFANASKSGYQYAVQYFDAQGRTIGAQTYINASFNTPAAKNDIRFCQTYLNIYNRPPLEALYYQVLRSNNTTYNKRLFWISDATFTSQHVDSDYVIPIVIPPDPYLTRFAYIDVKNIEEYNKSISSTQNIVSYTFTAGDRIRFLSRYNVSGEEIDIVNLDCEILGTVYTITTNYGTKEGNFIKINYPEEFIKLNPTFLFDTEEYWHYKIFIYNLSSSISSDLRVFYEFGKCFGIGNPGTSLAYHIGLEQTQSAINPQSVPAIISATNGDLFYRKRNVIYNNLYKFSGIGQESPAESFNAALKIKCENGGVDTTTYSIQTQDFDGPIDYNADNQFFYNKSSTQNITISIKCNFSATSSAAIDFNSFDVTLVYSTPYDLTPRGGRQGFVKLAPTAFLTDSATVISIDIKTVILPLAKVWIFIDGQALFNSGVTISSFEFNFGVLFNTVIPIIEQSFSDNYNLVTNSNGRPSVIDENAAKRYFPTLIRFGQAYQFNTNINGTNRFYYENFDEYDRSFGDVIRLHVRDRYLKVFQQFKVGNVPILTQIVKDSANNPLQANTDVLINKIQYYAGNYGIGDAGTSLAWNNFADYFVDNFRGVVCRLSQNGIEPISILYNTNAFFVSKTAEYRKDLNTGVTNEGTYTGNPCIYGVFDANTNKYIIAMEEINRYIDCTFNGGTAIKINSTTTTTTIAPTFTAATSSVSANDACGNPEAPSYLYTIIGGTGTTMCENVQIRSTYIDIFGETTPYFWTYNGINVREWQVLLSGLGYYYAIGYTSCTTCATTTTTTHVTTTTTTHAPTTTTTTLPIYYYNVTKYNCPGCTVSATNLLASSNTSLVNFLYYNNGDGYAYLINYGAGAGVVDVNLNGSASDISCGGVCGL